MIPAGRYKCQLEQHEVGESDSGTAFVKITFVPRARYTGGDAPEELTEVQTRNLFVYLSEKTMGTETKPGIAARALKNLGFTSEDITKIDPSHSDAHSFDGYLVDLVCKHEEYQGEAKEKWEVAAKSKPLSGGTLSALNAVWEKVRPAQEALPI